MSDLPVAVWDITPKVSLSAQDIIGIVRKIADTYSESFEHWSSVRSYGDKKSFRLGLRSKKKPELGALSHDVLFVPRNAEAPWFSYGEPYRSLRIESRVCPAGMDMPLQDNTEAETMLIAVVGLVKGMFEAQVQRLLEDRLTV